MFAGVVLAKAGLKSNPGSGVEKVFLFLFLFLNWRLYFIQIP